MQMGSASTRRWSAVFLSFLLKLLQIRIFEIGEKISARSKWCHREIYYNGAKRTQKQAHLARMCSNCSFYDLLCRMWKSRKLAFLRLRPLDGNKKTGLNSLSAKRSAMMTVCRVNWPLLCFGRAGGRDNFFRTTTADCGMNAFQNRFLVTVEQVSICLESPSSVMTGSHGPF